MYQQLNLICDQSTYANFYQWASAVSAWFAACGWAQGTDTGQQMWTGLSISGAAQSGSNTIYSYSGLTGLPLAVGRALTITGMQNSANNGVKVLTACSGTISGTFTVANASGVSESGSSGLVTAGSTLPGSAAYFYEIWHPNDGLTDFYLKVEYGNMSGTNCPAVRLTISTATNGAGTAGGTVMGPYTYNSSFTAPSTTIPYDCRFSGGPGRISFLLWRGAPNSAAQVYAIERSINASGTYTGAHVTLMLAGYCSQEPYIQQTLVFGLGVAPLQSAGNSSYGGMACRTFNLGSSNNSYFNNLVPFDTTAPFIGYFDYPLTSFGAVPAANGSEGALFTATIYGASHTYISTQSGCLYRCGPANSTIYFCMRYD